MNRHVRVAVNLSVFSLLLVLMVGWTVRNVVSVDRIEQPYLLSAEFPNAFGILPNAEVTYLGVSAGSVTNVERINGGVRIDLAIKRETRIPDGSTASVLRKSAIGEQYIDFDPPAAAESSGGYYEDGDVLGMDQTTVPLEFSELLRSADALLASLEPDDVRTLVHELAVGLDGRADDLQRLAAAGDELSASLAERTEVLDRLATNNTRLTHVVTEHRGSLGRSIHDLSLLAESLRAAEGDLTNVLDDGSALLGQTADVVAAQKGNLDCSLKVLEQLTDETTTPARLAGLRALLTWGPVAFGRVWDARDVEADGVWLRVGLIQNRENRAPQFVPPKPVPAVQRVPVCGSALRASSADYRPGAATGSGTGSLPATGGTSGLAAGVLALAGARWIRRLRRGAASR